MILRSFFIVIALGIPISVEAKQPSADTVTFVMKNTIEKFVRPRYFDFYSQTDLLKDRVSELCESPQKIKLQKAREQFDQVAISWGAIEVIRFGPVAKENRLERILFYPDRKSTGLKQVQRILAKKDGSSIAPEKLPIKSVAVQGLGALEFILFGTGSETLETGNDFRCEFGLNVSTNINSIGNELVDLWQENSLASDVWTKPSYDNQVFKNPGEAVNELLATLVHGLERVRDIRIGSFLKKTAEKDRPRSALFRRSENTIPMIVSNIRALEALLVDSDAHLLLDEEDQAIAGSIIFELKNAAKIAQEIPEPLANSLQSDELRKKLIYLKLTLKFAIDMLDQDFAAAAGLSSGFSFSDGD